VLIFQELSPSVFTYPCHPSQAAFFENVPWLFKMRAGLKGWPIFMLETTLHTSKAKDNKVCRATLYVAYMILSWRSFTHLPCWGVPWQYESTYLLREQHLTNKVPGRDSSPNCWVELTNCNCPYRVRDCSTTWSWKVCPLPTNPRTYKMNFPGIPKTFLSFLYHASDQGERNPDPIWEQHVIRYSLANAHEVIKTGHHSVIVCQVFLSIKCWRAWKVSLLNGTISVLTHTITHGVINKNPSNRQGGTKYRHMSWIHTRQPKRLHDMHVKGVS